MEAVTSKIEQGERNRRPEYRLNDLKEDLEIMGSLSQDLNFMGVISQKLGWSGGSV